MRIVWSVKAFFDLQGIHRRITEDLSVTRADAYVNELLVKIDRLKSWPTSSSPCRNEKLQKAGWRCMNHRRQYVLVYEIDGSDIILIAILSSKKNPKDFEALL